MVESVSPPNDDVGRKVHEFNCRPIVPHPSRQESEQQKFTNLPNVLPDGSEVHEGSKASNDFRLE